MRISLQQAYKMHTFILLVLTFITIILCSQCSGFPTFEPILSGNGDGQKIGIENGGDESKRAKEIKFKSIVEKDNVDTSQDNNNNNLDVDYNDFFNLCGLPPFLSNEEKNSILQQINSLVQDEEKKEDNVNLHILTALLWSLSACTLICIGLVFLLSMVYWKGLPWSVPSRALQIVNPPSLNNNKSYNMTYDISIPRIKVQRPSFDQQLF